MSFLKTKKAILINTSLIPSIDDISYKKINFFLGNKKIEFTFMNESYTLETEDNIIALKKENDIKIQSPNLMQLTKIYCFRKYLNEEIAKEHSIKNSHNNIYLIEKQIIDKYLFYFNYKSLSKILNGINIDSKNINEKYKSLIEIIKIKDDNYYKELKEKEKDNFFLNFIGENKLIPQAFDSNGKQLFYLSDFEIVSKDIYEFFKEIKIINIAQAIKGEYIVEDGKLFLNYEFNGKNYYEIGFYDNNNENFIIEYIIEDSNSQKKKNNRQF